MSWAATRIACAFHFVTETKITASKIVHVTKTVLVAVTDVTILFVHSAWKLRLALAATLKKGIESGRSLDNHCKRAFYENAKTFLRQMKIFNNVRANLKLNSMSAIWLAVVMQYALIIATIIMQLE